MKKILKNLVWMVGLVMVCVSSAWAVPEGKVNINTATPEVLADMLVGVGESRADAIVEHRETHGDFAELADLLAVKGIGSRVLEDNAQRIVLSE
ncbi:MAG: helix-hairpin-helix domain-containing protein [Pseudomonadota bacterium]